MFDSDVLDDGLSLGGNPFPTNKALYPGGGGFRFSSVCYCCCWLVLKKAVKELSKLGGRKLCATATGKTGRHQLQLHPHVATVFEEEVVLHKRKNEI
jgi:hypothetical protein